MDQLSGLDAAFIHQDSPRTPMHITAVLIYQNGPEGERAFGTEDIHHVVAERLRGFPLFSRKLLRVPMRMDTPYWVEVKQLDLGSHIRESHLPPGSDWRYFQAILASRHQKQMNLSQPLWEMELIHGLTAPPGLTGSYQALIFKAHHAAVDGMSLAAIIHAMHQTGPISKKTCEAISTPDHWDMWARFGENSFDRQLRLAGTLGNLVPRLLAAREATKPFRDLAPISRSPALFNARVMPGRNTGAILVPLKKMQAIKRAIRRVTLNDIAIAIVAGGLRKYLQQRGCLPRHTLSCGAPISLRKQGDRDAKGNQIATMVVGMATHVADPVDRLRLVHRYALAGKKRIQALGAATVMDISDSLPPGMLADTIKIVGRFSSVADIPVPFHTMISNVVTPIRGDMCLGNAPLLVSLGLGPIRDNMGLFHIVANGSESLSIAFSACKVLLPDPQRYEAFLEESFEELYAAVTGFA